MQKPGVLLADRPLSGSAFPLCLGDMLRIWFGSSPVLFSVLQYQNSAVSRLSSILRPDGSVSHGDVSRIVELQGDGQSGVMKNLGSLSQELSKRAFADRPRVPASAELSTVGTWFHQSTVVNSRISPTLLATNTGFLSIEWSH